jgi:hypothetical protein
MKESDIYNYKRAIQYEKKTLAQGITQATSLHTVIARIRGQMV